MMTQGTASARERTRFAPRRLPGWTLVLPGVLFLAVFFIVPLALMLANSLKDGVVTYAEVFTSPSHMKVFGNTLKTAVITTVVCLASAYPYAYVMQRVGARLRLLLTALVLMPFWVSVLTRSFAWVGLLQDTGVINQTLMDWGVTDAPLPLIRTELGVLIGMVHVLLPFTVIPLMNAMGNIDGSYLRAAVSLGANPWQRFFKVFLPLSVPGVLAGGVLVFVMSLGFYITPALLGSPDNMMVGELLIQEVQKIGTVRASAIGMILLGGTLVSLALVAAVQQITTTTKEKRK
ncbi:ABC transporter permease [Pseudoclavibacter sp. 13-3]|uniref:ABC transporter permease n=1 Tax=Pseudoclavibacter sp. 13-3 TaxID=2901228 RepID=UPI001E5B9CB2|nr:ABC transporter permease [Pseudoclavibacter sp. 13-3]MCD7101305.1 ABC transporter permease [Pseudoclavibacter sp. 13-3]